MKELIEVVPDEEEREVKVANIRKLENVLLSNNNLTTLQLDDEFVDAFIARIEPCEGRKFKWYLNIGSGKGWRFSIRMRMNYTIIGPLTLRMHADIERLIISI